MSFPRHVAIIMDGNGRWAKAKKHHRVYGHARGAHIALKTIRHAAKIGLKNLTLFAFSTENWQRPTTEVAFLMKLLARRVTREIPTLIENNIRFRALGSKLSLPQIARDAVLRAEEMTAKNTGMNLQFALSYGGRQEIVHATRKIADNVRAGLLNPEDISEKLISKNLELPDLPDPDLVIRTSGEHRVSNFMLWQIAYSELIILNKHWPDFNEGDFDAALDSYSQRNRRYGQVKENYAEPT